MMWLFGPAMLAWEAQQVIALRMAKVALGGPDAMVEVDLMVQEKLDASTSAANLMSAAMLRGTPDEGPAEVVEMLRSRVQANMSRLTQD